MIRLEGNSSKRSIEVVAAEQLSIWLARATTEGRVALHSLRTSTTETNDLAESFRRAIEECRLENSMETSFSLVGDTRDMHPIVRDEVYRVGYEAIRNACVHSQASKLRVTLTYSDDQCARCGRWIGNGPVDRRARQRRALWFAGNARASCPHRRQTHRNKFSGGRDPGEVGCPRKDRLSKDGFRRALTSSEEVNLSTNRSQLVSCP